jgi:hypothetical protein
MYKKLLLFYTFYTPTYRDGAILQSHCPLVCLSVHTFVTDISASTGRNDCTSTSCLPCDLQMNEWGYSLHDVACNILFPLISQSQRDIFSINGRTKILKIIAQCDIKCIMTLQRRTVISVLNVSRYIYYH